MKGECFLVKGKSQTHRILSLGSDRVWLGREKTQEKRGPHRFSLLLALETHQERVCFTFAVKSVPGTTGERQA